MIERLEICRDGGVAVRLDHDLEGHDAQAEEGELGECEDADHEK
jgi:hypothetical protein